jgi:hypothetical protein
MPDLGDDWKALAEVRAVRDEARAAHRRALFDLNAIDAGIEAARRAAAFDPQARERLAQLVKDREAKQAEIATGAQALADADARARGELVGRFEATPQTLIEGLSDETPFLLLPLRLETRFGQRDGVPVLRLRIFPDDVAIAQHEKALTQGEVDDGRAYWKERVRANGEPDAREKDRIVNGAWNALATRHDAYRASWIARATQPTNWSDALFDPAAAAFGPVDTKPLGWSDAPRSFVLPDRFVVRLDAGGTSREVLGGFIPNDLPLGPDPLQAEGVFTRDDATGRLKVDAAIAWLVDFDAAVKVGMALEIPLQLPREANGFDRIIVIGLRLSSAPADSAALVARLIEAQRYSRGVAIVPQGTPTNNTDDAQSGLSTASESIDETLALELDPNALPFESDHFKKCDGQRLAEALSIPLDVVRTLPHANRTDVAEALAMNRALFSGTLGDFAHDMLDPVMSAATIERLRRFVGAYVAGRGLLPAVRIGSEPYGVLATSALSLWTWREDETGQETSFWNGLLVHLRTLAELWDRLAQGVSHVGGSGDPFATLLSVIGLQASSVEYYARKAIASDYLANYTRFRGTPQAFATKVWEDLQAAVGGNLSAIGLDPSLPFRLRSLVFWREHDLLNGSVIDDDPRVPFSETRGIRAFDGVRNYIDWFATASADDIRQQVFKGADGKVLAPPATLLYRLLRESFLGELGRGGRSAVGTYDSAVFAELDAEPAIANVGVTKTFSTGDVLNVDASKIGASTSRVSVADYLVAGARAVVSGALPPPEAVGLADLHAALTMLAPLPTARLERLLAEHVDLCSYRLDAWIHGLFARRLWQLRERAGDAPPSLHIGCYGYVEGVFPSQSPRQIVTPDALPPSLRADAPATVFEDPANGGFVHAPSLTHAATAAVLRNGYLSHAEPSRADTMTVNLSSSRVRVALRFLDGLRSGQELAALLGYQIERGLHEGHPGVELDQFIYVLRERFPFTSGKLTDVPAGTSAESMEARNVVNGYDLLDYVRGRAYPYGIAGLPADIPGSPTQAQAAAIRDEVDELADTMDSIADLMLAESVHQVVQGNYERAKGVLQSITEGTSPPEPQVIDTPRSGRTLGFRLALPLDVAETAGWSTTLSPRAVANAALNHWLASALPAPGDIQWQVTNGAAPPEFVSLASLNLEPLDCVLMAGDHLGDLSSELERLLVYYYRVANAVPDAMATVILTSDAVPPPGPPALVIDPRAAQAGKLALASVLPLLKALRRLVSRSRALNARDFELPSEAQSIEPANPKGFDDGAPPLKGLADLKSRVEQGYSTLLGARDVLRNFLATTITPLYGAFDADPAHAIVPQWAIDLPKLRDLMVAIARVGVAEALPTAGLDVTSLVIDALVLQARAAVDVVSKRLDAARAALDTTFADPLPSDPVEAQHALAFRTETLVQQYGEAARQIFGGGFVALPLFRVHAQSQAELSAAIATPAASNPLAVEGWLQSLVRVRAAIGAIGTVSMYRDWIGGATAPAMSAVQLPARPGDPWIGAEYGDALPAGDVVSIALCAPMPAVAGLQCGLMIDEWTELVPTNQETTGIAFHFNRPNAMAPQSLLLAIAPRLTGTWKWNDLVAVIEETVARAKMRAVEPDSLIETPYFQAFPAILSEFSAGGFRSTVFAQQAVVASQLAAGPA